MVENTLDYSYDKKIILQKWHLKLLKKFLRQIYLTKNKSIRI